MTIYIELVFVQNFLVDSVILWSIYYFARLRLNKQRLFFGAFFGACISILFPLAKLPFLLELVLKILSGFVITCISFKTKNFIELCKYFLFLITSTFVLGGIVYGLLSLFKKNIAKTNLENFILTATVCSVIIFCFCIVKISKYLYKKIKKISCNFDGIVQVRQKQVDAKCFYDTGNRLIDKNTGQPVNIMSLSLFEKLCGKDILKKVAFGNLSEINLQNPNMIDFSSVGSEGKKLFVFSVDKLEINIDHSKKIIKNARFGVMLKDFSNQHFDVLLNSSII